MSYGNLYIISTPIGNSDDITLRAINLFKNLEIIACEDTRITSKLCQIHNIDCKNKLISYHEHNSTKMIPKIIDLLIKGTDIGFVSDAGTPLISDPGYKLVRSAIENNILIKSVPGASAMSAAISISGMSTDQFFFIGFLPKKKALKLKKIEQTCLINSSIIIFESSKRLLSTLKDLLSVLGNRKVSILREITKRHEENIFGTFNSVINSLRKKNIRGEIVIVIEKNENINKINEKEKIISMLEESMKKNSISEASKEIAKKTLLKKDNIYKLALKIKRNKD